MDRHAFTTITDPLPEAILLIGPPSRILAANRAARARLPRLTEPLDRQDLLEFVVDSRNHVYDYLRHCTRSRDLVFGAMTFKGSPAPVPYRVEGVRCSLPDDASAGVLLRVTPKSEAATKFIALGQKIEELSHEIARRKTVERMLREEREWFRVTLGSIGDAVMTTDIAGRVTYMNSVAEKLTGWALSDCRGRPVTDIFRIVNEETRRPMADPVTQVLERGQVTGLANHTLLRPKEGPECPIDDSAAPIRDADGRIIGVVLVFHDVTARREAARAERQTHAKLMEKVIELEQFERAVVGRELRMVELEKENAAIKKELERLKARRET